MGGYGSGRRTAFAGKPETHAALPLDIREIAKTGLLESGNRFNWHWLLNKRKLASISIGVSLQSMMLAYRYKRTGELIEQWVQMQTTLCHLGGQRHWFSCPQCCKRVAVLYLNGRKFACRQCGGLGYATQKENPGDRLFTKADKLRTRLGWQVGIANADGDKPKGMHWNNFERLTSQHSKLLIACILDTQRKFGGLLKKIESSKSVSQN